MKGTHLRSGKLVIGILSAILFVFLLMNMRTILQTIHLKKEIATYTQYEKSNIKISIEIIQSAIARNLQFRLNTSHDQKNHFRNLSNKSVEEIEQIVRIGMPERESILRAYDEHDITDYRTKIATTRIDALALFYQDLLLLSFFNLILDDLYIESDFGFPRLKFLQPVTEDSTYLGYLPWGSGLVKYEYRINNVHYWGNKDEFTVPVQDTLQIKVFEINAYGLTIDTISSQQTIAKTGNTWKRI